jgi:hypothetical protein
MRRAIAVIYRATGDEAALNACHLSSVTQLSLMRLKDLATLDLFSSGRY